MPCCAPKCTRGRALESIGAPPPPTDWRTVLRCEASEQRAVAHLCTAWCHHCVWGQPQLRGGDAPRSLAASRRRDEFAIVPNLRPRRALHVSGAARSFGGGDSSPKLLRRLPHMGRALFRSIGGMCERAKAIHDPYDERNAATQRLRPGARKEGRAGTVRDRCAAPAVDGLAGRT